MSAERAGHAYFRSPHFDPGERVHAPKALLLEVVAGGKGRGRGGRRALCSTHTHRQREPGPLRAAVVIGASMPNAHNHQRKTSRTGVIL